MHLHILGIGGTFMGGVALLAQQLGHTVTGCDQHIYPPMSTQLADWHIPTIPSFDPKELPTHAEQILVGNVLSRGTPIIERLLTSGTPYQSGPEWLRAHVLKDRWVVAVSGTHGKTTTCAMIAWILTCAGLDPGFLIGGIPLNFGVSAQLGSGPHFVIEADEYDSAFFDKRSKFMHYRPKTLVINNLEFDHADIFTDLAAIKTQFRHLLATVPGDGLLIANDHDSQVHAVLESGVWTPIAYFGSAQSLWHATEVAPDGSAFQVCHQQKVMGRVQWSLLGQHNVHNACAALAAAAHVGVSIPQAIQALSTFQPVKRRLEIKGRRGHITVYDDFAHHPTAIETVLSGLRAHVGDQEQILVVLSFSSYTMRHGVHDPSLLIKALRQADAIAFFDTTGHQKLHHYIQQLMHPLKQNKRVGLFTDIQEMTPWFRHWTHPKSTPVHVVTMSNQCMDALHQSILASITNPSGAR